jgi:glycine dehydrogenase subunit 1
VLEIERDPEKVLGALTKLRILGGLSLRKYYPELNRHLLVTVTETNTKEEIDRWAVAVREILNSK